MTQTESLIDKLADACRAWDHANGVAGALSRELTLADTTVLDAHDAVRKIEREILLEAINRTAEQDSGQGREEHSPAKMSVKVELPSTEDAVVKDLVQAIVHDVCEALIQRLQHHAEGAGRNPT